MTDLTRQDIQNLELFARIKCDPSEEEALLAGISKILKYVDQLNEIDTTNVKACDFILGELQQNILREDDIIEVMPRELFLSNAPEQIAGMIKTPPILNKED